MQRFDLLSIYYGTRDQTSQSQSLYDIAWSGAGKGDGKELRWKELRYSDLVTKHDLRLFKQLFFANSR